METALKNVVFDTNYTKEISLGGYPHFDKNLLQQKVSPTKKLGFLDKIFNLMFTTIGGKKKTPGIEEEHSMVSPKLASLSLKDQLKVIIEMDDKDYDDKLLTSELRKYLLEIEKEYLDSMTSYKSHIAPGYREVDSNHFLMSGIFGRCYYTHSYPSYIDFLWTRNVLSFYSKWDMSIFIYPEDDSAVQSMMKKRATQLKAQISEAASKGMTLDTEVELEYKDVEEIRQKLTTREERYFETGMYINLFNDNLEKLNEDSKKFEQKIGGYGIRIKSATQRMDEGIVSCLPLGIDDLSISRSMVSTSLGGSFPFISSDLIESTGILYGINLHTGSLVVFDRFSSKLPNANSIVLATSGAGKSFTVKLEILRYLLLGIPTIVIDPENEYKHLIEKAGGTYINIAVNSNQYINPFDLPPKIEDAEYGKGDLLRSQILNLIALIAVLVGGLTPEEEALLDKAIQSTYALKEITFEDEFYGNKTPPLMQDLLYVLEGMSGGEKLAIRISKYVTGTFGKLFNNYTNVDLDSGLTIFSIRDLEETLKTPAMFNILNYIWTKVRSKKIKRLLVVDEAWIMMQQEVSANFLFSLVKRARKYGLGITTISQDVEDFIKSKYGKPIVSNSAVQLLMKQSTSSIRSLNEVFALSEAEQQKLVSSNVGEGLFFAGNQHVAIKILASPREKEFITTDII